MHIYTYFAILIRNSRFTLNSDKFIKFFKDVERILKVLHVFKIRLFYDLGLVQTYSTGVNKSRSHSTKFTFPGELSPGILPAIDVEHIWWKNKDKHVAHLPQQCHNSKCVTFQEKILKVSKCYNFLWVHRRHYRSPAASFANCVLTV
jgi:hypothetical protein